MDQNKPRRGRQTLSEDTLDTRRDAIAQTALRLFLDEGFASVSMRRLGKEVGLSPMALYRYFPSKRDILARLWAHILDRAFERVSKAVDTHGTGAESLRAASQAYVGYWMDHTDHYHLVFMSGGVSNAAVTSFVGRTSTIAHYDVFFSLVAEILSEPRSSGATQRRTDGLITHLHGIMHSALTMQGYEWTDWRLLVTDAVETVVVVSQR